MADDEVSDSYVLFDGFSAGPITGEPQLVSIPQDDSDKIGCFLVFSDACQVNLTDENCPSQSQSHRTSVWSTRAD